MFVSVLERQRAILEDGYHHTVVWQRYCRKLTLWAYRPHPILLTCVEFLLKASTSKITVFEVKCVFWPVDWN